MFIATAGWRAPCAIPVLQLPMEMAYALAAGELLPGAATDGVGGVPLQPWLGRRHDPKLGFGRRLSQAVLVRMHGRSEHDARFLPCATGTAAGCWQVAV
jgi:hypothetical protein